MPEGAGCDLVNLAAQAGRDHHRGSKRGTHFVLGRWVLGWAETDEERKEWHDRAWGPKHTSETSLHGQKRSSSPQRPFLIGEEQMPSKSQQLKALLVLAFAIFQ